MAASLACIVEGQGEEAALPILIRRVLSESAPAAFIAIEKPLRISRDRLLKPGELERAVELAIRGLPERRAVLIVIDSEGALPCELAPRLLERARTARPDVASAVVIAHQEWEAWYLAAAQSIAGKRGIPAELTPPENPESVRGAKEWLGRRMPLKRKYSEVRDQPALAALFDLDAARCCPSFSKFCRELLRLHSVLVPGSGGFA